MEVVKTQIDKLFENAYFREKLHDYIVNNLKVSAYFNDKNQLRNMYVSFEGDPIDVDFDYD